MGKGRGKLSMVFGQYQFTLSKNVLKNNHLISFSKWLVTNQHSLCLHFFNSLITSTNIKNLKEKEILGIENVKKNVEKCQKTKFLNSSLKLNPASLVSAKTQGHLYQAVRQHVKRRNSHCLSSDICHTTAESFYLR